MSDYFSELDTTMGWLSEQPKVKFIGQSVVWDGHSLFKSMTGVHIERRLELPVMEDFQMGMSIGLALEGWIPVNVYPRMDFLIIATNQLLNHLANIKKVSNGGYQPKVITRVSVGAKEPMHPGDQHCQDYSVQLESMIGGRSINVIRLVKKEMIRPCYEEAYYREDGMSTILVEFMSLYHS